MVVISPGHIHTIIHCASLEGINTFRHASLPEIIDETMKRNIKPHHAHIGSHLAYLCLNFNFNGLWISSGCSRLFLFQLLCDGFTDCPAHAYQDFMTQRGEHCIIPSQINRKCL